MRACGARDVRRKRNHAERRGRKTSGMTNLALFQRDCAVFKVRASGKKRKGKRAEVRGTPKNGVRVRLRAETHRR